MLAGRRRGLDRRLALAGAGGDVAVDELAQLDQVGGVRRGVAEDAAHGHHVDVDTALEVGAADAAAARLDEQAHRVAQALGVATDARADTAHRHLAIVRIDGHRVVPLAAEASRAEARGKGRAKPFLGGAAHERPQVGDRRRLQQCIGALHAAELRGETGVDRVLVQVEHHTTGATSRTSCAMACASGVRSSR